LIQHDALVHGDAWLNLQDFLERLRDGGGHFAGLRRDLRGDFFASPKGERAK
jgi:hypothetical protein